MIHFLVFSSGLIAGAFIGFLMAAFIKVTISQRAIDQLAAHLKNHAPNYDLTAQTLFEENSIPTTTNMKNNLKIIILFIIGISATATLCIYPIFIDPLSLAKFSQPLNIFLSVITCLSYLNAGYHIGIEKAIMSHREIMTSSFPNLS